MKNIKKKLLIVTGTRAEYGLFRSTIFALKNSKRLNVKLLVTGMHTLKKFGYTIHEIQKDMPIDCIVPIAEHDDTLCSLSKEILGIKKYLKKNPIDAMVVIGDRDEPFAAAIVGIHSNIPVFHVSGGDVSGPTVDHYLRNAITVFSKLHLVQTKQSKNNVVRLGANNKNVHIVGSTGLDGLVPENLYQKKEVGSILGLSPDKKWNLAVLHPTPFENVSFSNQIQPVLQALKKLKKENEIIIIYPNSDTGSDVFIQEIESTRAIAHFHIFKNLERKQFLSILCHSQALIGNSSSGLMEAGYLKKPFICVGNRQKNREHGKNTIMVPYNAKSILNAIKKISTKNFQNKIKKSKPIYFGGDVSGRMLKHIEQFLTSQ